MSCVGYRRVLSSDILRLSTSELFCKRNPANIQKNSKQMCSFETLARLPNLLSCYYRSRPVQHFLCNTNRSWDLISAYCSNARCSVST